MLVGAREESFNDIFLPWPLPERQAMVLWPPIRVITEYLTEQTRTDMSAKPATGVEE